MANAVVQVKPRRSTGRHYFGQNESMVERVRIDKWLWAARFFKTRTLASRACELGRVECRGEKVKPARDVHVGDLLGIKNASGDFEIEVLLLSDMRGPAPVAQTLYRETPASRELRLKVAEQRKAMPRIDSVPAGRPSKRERRSLARLRGRD
jgi:ribosome-associated heat shock protein Hsp15